MRTIRTTIVGLATLALLAASSLGVAAQSPIRVSWNPTYVTGTLEGGTLEAEGVVGEADGVTQSQGVGYAGVAVVTADKRLAGTLSTVGNWADYGDGLRYEVGTVEIAADQGGWVGTSTAFVAETPGAGIETIALTGTGVYEGLSAYLVVDSSGPARTFQGIVVPGPLPDASAAPAAP